jgi:hypothetical protein
VILFVGIWWKVSAHKWFTGQVRNVEIDEALHETTQPKPAAP